MKDKKIITQYKIILKIYAIRGRKVMVYGDLAELYGVETRVLNQAIRRNINRFPGDFMFSLTREEINNLSQIVISSKIKHSPNVFVFTEQGVAMLSSVLNSERAVRINIQIMRTFVKLKEMILTNSELRLLIQKLEQRLDKYGNQVLENKEQIQILANLIKQILEPRQKPKKRIGFITD